MNTAKKAGARRLLGLLLALAMLVGMAPLAMPTALAAGTVTGSGTETNPYVVTDYDGLRDVLMNRGSSQTTYLKLGASFDTKSKADGAGITDATRIDIRQTFVLDLNGHKAELYALSINHVIRIIYGGLTVLDSSVGRTGELQGSGDVNYFILLDYGKFTLNSGTVSANLIDFRWRSVIRTTKTGQAKVTVNGGALNIETKGRLCSTENGYGFEPQDYALYIEEGDSAEINGGTFNGRVLFCGKTVAPSDTTKKLIVNGGNFKGSIFFDIKDGEEGATVTPVEINGGIFEYDVEGRTRRDPSRYSTIYHTQFDDMDGRAVFKTGTVIYAQGNSRSEGDKWVFVNEENAENIYNELCDRTSYGQLSRIYKSPITVSPNAVGIKDVKLNGTEIEYGYNSANTQLYEVLLDEQNTLEFSWYDLSWTMKAYGFSYSYSYNIAVNGVETVTGGTVNPTYKDGAITWKYVVPGGGAQRNVTVQLLLYLMKDGEPVNTAMRDSYLVRLHCVNNMTQIPAVALTQKDGDITKEGNYGVNTRSISPANAAQQARYTVDSQTEWQGSFNTISNIRYFIEGDKYTKTVVLKAKSGYQFSASCSVAVDAASTDIISKTLSADKKTMTIKLQAQCVKVLDNATGILYGFKLGEYVGSTYIESDEPDKYRLELVYIGVRVSGSDSMLVPGNQFERDKKYTFGVKVIPQKGYGFKQSSFGKVMLMYFNTDDSPVYFIGNYKDAATVGSTGYTGPFFETETVAGMGTRAPEQRLGRLDITIKEPVAGESAADQSYKAISLSKLDLQVAKYVWTNTSGQVITGEFQPNTPYTCSIEITLPWYYEAKDDYWDIYINGESVSSWLVEENGKKYIGTAEGYKTAGGTVPTGYTVYGAATSFGSQTDDVTIQLIESGTSEPAYEVTVAGSGTSYSIENVVPGTYTMKVMKQNHVTREYTVTVSDGNVMQAAEIWLLGDVTGDGKVNIRDVSALYDHFNKVKLLTDYEFQCGEVTADGKINIRDVSKVNDHFNKVTMLW